MLFLTNMRNKRKVGSKILKQDKNNSILLYEKTCKIIKGGG